MLHPQHHSTQVDVHQPVVELHGEVGQGAAVGDAGHVEHDVHPAELLHGGGHGRFDVGLLGDVAVHGENPVPDLGRRVLLGTADVGRHHLGALTDEDLDRCLAHSRTGTGDHGHLPVQQSHHVPPASLGGSDRTASASGLMR